MKTRTITYYHKQDPHSVGTAKLVQHRRISPTELGTNRTPRQPRSGSRSAELQR